MYEAWHTGTKNDSNALKLLTYGVHWEQLEKVFIDLDVSKAKATVQADREKILMSISQNPGILTMTFQLKDALVNSIVASLPPDDIDHPWTEQVGDELYKVS